jgi:hypothetical protein
MTSVVVSSGLVVYKEIISKRSGDYLYLLLRGRKRKKKQQFDFYPIVKALKFNKYLIRQLTELEIGDIITVKGVLGFLNVKLHYPQLTPPFITAKKMIIFISDMEWERHIDIKETKIETFFSFDDDDYLKTLTEDEINRMEEIIEEKLGKKGD